MTGVELITAERERQIAVEGWTPMHDTEHDSAQMVQAARAYTWVALCQVTLSATAKDFKFAPNDWPHTWGYAFWKPDEDPLRNLVKAGALIAAEIDRLKRISGGEQLEQQQQKQEDR